MGQRLVRGLRWVFDPACGGRNHLIARWAFLRALGLIYLSAFYALLFQVKGLIGPGGILPAREYLADVAQGIGPHVLRRWWFAPTLLWWGSGSHMLMAMCWVGLAAAVLLVVNVWPRGMLGVCFVCFLSFVAAAGEFSGYQSDGMLLEAGFISLFLAPGGWRPGLGAGSLPARASVLLLLWEWFRIYFQSGAVKLLSGDPSWRNWTAMDEYYQNGPLPSWVGWYVQHLPHRFHAGTVFATLLMELLLVWMVFLGRRWRVVCFWIVTVWQAGVILTANYAFLNYLVLVLGVLLLDDVYLRRWVPGRWRREEDRAGLGAGVGEADPSASLRHDKRNASLGDAKREEGGAWRREEDRTGSGAVVGEADPSASLRDDKQDASLGDDKQWALLGGDNREGSLRDDKRGEGGGWRRQERGEGVWGWLRFAVTAVLLGWVFYATLVPAVRMFWRGVPLPIGPVVWLEPFRVANQYGLFAVMTPHRYEIEFQGSNDGQNWVAYPFRYKAQDVRKRPGLYAPYQPRFDWNLWFASLGSWTEYPMVPRTEERLLEGQRDVLGLFAGDPFGGKPPRYVRAVLWKYWFSSMAEKKQAGVWWERELLGTYAPTLARMPDGRFGILERPTLSAGMPD